MTIDEARENIDEIFVSLGFLQTNLFLSNELINNTAKIAKEADSWNDLSNAGHEIKRISNSLETSYNQNDYWIDEINKKVNLLYNDLMTLKNKE